MENAEKSAGQEGQGWDSAHRERFEAVEESEVGDGHAAKLPCVSARVAGLCKS